MADKTQDWGWGSNPDEFPLGLFDDFDGPLIIFEYEESEQYDTLQIHTMIQPEAYEFEARDLDHEDGSTDGFPQGWYSLGRLERLQPEVSADAMNLDVIKMPPQRNTRGVKLMLAMQKAVSSIDGIKLSKTAKNLKPFISIPLHWKAVMERTQNPTTGEYVERAILYPIGPAVGNAAVLGESSSRASREAPSSNGGSSRAAPVAEPDAQEQAEDMPNGDEAEVAASPGQEEDAANTLNDKAIDLIVRCVTEADDSVIRRRRLGNALGAYEEEVGEDLVEAASEADMITMALRRGVIIEDENDLKLP